MLGSWERWDWGKSQLKQVKGTQSVRDGTKEGYRSETVNFHGLNLGNLTS
jgi:hypothetical protein